MARTNVNAPTQAAPSVKKEFVLPEAAGRLVFEEVVNLDELLGATRAAGTIVAFNRDLAGYYGHAVVSEPSTNNRGDVIIRVMFNSNDTQADGKPTLVKWVFCKLVGVRMTDEGLTPTWNILPTRYQDDKGVWNDGVWYSGHDVLEDVEYKALDAESKKDAKNPIVVKRTTFHRALRNVAFALATQAYLPVLRPSTK